MYKVNARALTAALEEEAIVDILPNWKEALIGCGLLLSLLGPGTPAVAETTPGTPATPGIAFVSTAATAQVARVSPRGADNRRNREGLTDFEVIEAEGLPAGVVMLSYENETPANAPLSEAQGPNTLELASIASAAVAIESSAARAAINASLDQISAVETALEISCKRLSSRVWLTEQQDKEQQLARNSLHEAKLSLQATNASLVELRLALETLTKSDELAVNRVSATAPEILELLTPSKPTNLAALKSN